jgi:hypothetical protein
MFIFLHRKKVLLGMAGVIWIRLVELAVKFWLLKMMLHPRARSPVPLVKKHRGWAPFFLFYCWPPPYNAS